MDKDRFNTLLADMDKITDKDIKSLNQLRKQSPYFQNQYVMIAKALKKRNHPKTNAFIKKAAIYSTDRALLKAIIMGAHDFAPIVEESVPPPPPKKTEKKAPAPVVTKKQAEEVSPKPPEPATTEVKKEKPVVAENPALKPVSPPAKAVHHAPVKPAPEKATEAPAPTVAPTSSNIPKPESNQALIDELERDLIEIRKKKQLIAKMLEQQEAKQNTEKSTAAKKKTPPGKTSQIELIEKFIRNEPQLGKQQLVYDESTQHHQDLAAQYTKEHEAFYTETMAKLMVKQQKYRKAIQIYEKLGLKFPEKRTYFASQIEKVKEKSNG